MKTTISEKAMFDRASTNDISNQILSAILDGKYSWACFLILTSGGYDPANYLPYRTYYRLLKQNKLGHFSNSKRASTKSKRQSDTSKLPESEALKKRSTIISDLSYLHTSKDGANVIKGGFLNFC